MNVAIRYLLIGALLAVTGCAEMAGEVVCLTGVCASKEDRLTAIPWSPTNLGNKGCPSIDGEYKDEDLLFRQFDFRARSSNMNRIQGGYEVYQKIPFVPIKQPIKYVSGKPTNEMRIFEDESDFYRSAVTSIKQQGQFLETTLMDEKGTKYKKSILVLDHPQIGCLDDALVIREINAIGSNPESGLGFANASERKFRKLPDGSLQIVIRKREWHYSSSRGLIGIGADGHASGTEPRKSEVTLIFPAVQQPAP